MRLAAALRPALAARGVPDSIYVDNGSAFVDAVAAAGVRQLGHQADPLHPGPARRAAGRSNGSSAPCASSSWSRSPGTPATAPAPVADLAELNRLFTAWVETVYHRAIHSETGTAPLRRWCAGCPARCPDPEPGALAEAFLWSEYRTVTKTATVSLQGNLYQVDPLLVGRRVELVFDPFDLTEHPGPATRAPAGTAIPHRIGRHAHPKARPETPPEPPAPTGIDYARLIDTTTPSSRCTTASTTPPSPTSTPADSSTCSPAPRLDRAATAPIDGTDLLSDAPTTDGVAA